MKMTGAEMVVKSLEREGVNCVFGLPGATVVPIYDALYQDTSVFHILMRHEQAACHAADGYARVSGNVGVCLVTSGPGATNVLTGLATAMMDSVPIVVIAGHVANSMMGTDAFQEADMLGSSAPFIKHSVMVRTIEELPGALKNAFMIAASGRPGPVMVMIPIDVQRETGGFAHVQVEIPPGFTIASEPDFEDLSEVCKAISEARQPVILAGGGIILSGASGQLLELAEKGNIPVATTLMGKGSIPENSPYSLGMAGMHGTPQANLALSNCDLLIAVGTRFSDRTTCNVRKFAPGATIIHIDLDKSEFDKNIHPHITIRGDAGNVMNRIILVMEPVEERNCWFEQIISWRESNPIQISPYPGVLSTPGIIRKIQKYIVKDHTMVTEVGQHQMFAALHWKVLTPRSFITSGGLGTMGFGLPAAIGASFAQGRKPVLCLAGEGSFQMNSQELETCVRYQIPIKIILVNNGSLGLVRQWQELFANERYSHTTVPTECDFARLASAYGIFGITVRSYEEFDKGMNQIFEKDGPALIDCRVSWREKIMPMVPPGKGLDGFILRDLYE